MKPESVKLSFVLLFATLCMAYARVMVFNNTETLVPSVQKEIPANCIFTLPSPLAIELPKGEEIIRDQLAHELKRLNLSVSSQATPFFTFRLTNEDVPQNPEGYRLVADITGFHVTARTVDGLYWGAQTVRNILRNAAKNFFTGCLIEDWPDLQRRGYLVNIRKMKTAEIPQFKNTIDALSSLKINTLFIDAGEAFPYKNNEFTKRRNSFTEEQLRDLLTYCRIRHIQPVPTLQILSHTEWLTTHKDWNQISEGKPNISWNVQCCPQNERGREIIQSVLQEQAAFFGSNAFNVELDEIYLGTIFKQCPRCKGADTFTLVNDYIQFIDGILRPRGIHLVVCHDSFVSKQTYLLDWSIGDKLRENLPKDTEIFWWNYRDQLSEEQLLPFKNFRIHGHALNGKPYNTHNMAKLMQKHHGIGLAITYWYYSLEGCFCDLTHKETPDSLGGFVNGADTAWHLTDTHYADLPYDGTFEMMRRLRPEWLTPPPQNEEASPVPLEALVNNDLSTSGDFPILNDAMVSDLSSALQSLPEKFRLVTTPGGHYYGLRLSGSPDLKNGRLAIAIPMHNKKARQFAFLLTASRPSNDYDYVSAGVRGSKRFTFADVASLTLEYADGTKERTLLKFRQELNEWNRPFGGYRTRHAIRGLDMENRYYTFGIFDMRNPHPEKELKTIYWGTQMMDGVSPVLLALSCWGLDTPFAPVQPQSDLTTMKNHPYPAKPDTRALQHISENFETGMGSVFIDTTGRCKPGKVTTEIIQDPLRGKVLKVTVAPPAQGPDRDYVSNYRISVDLPYTITPQTKMLTFDCKLVGGVGFTRCQVYLCEKLKGDGEYWYRIAPNISDEWHSIALPIRQPGSGNPLLKTLEKTSLRRHSFFFSKIPQPIELYFDNIGDSDALLPSVKFWRLGEEGEPL